MAWTIDVLSSDEYEGVRKLIDISLTANELPDATIGLSVFEGEAADIIKDALSAISDAEATANLPTIRRAVIRLTASYLAPKVPFLTSEVLEGDRFTFANRDLAQIAADLEKQAFALVARILKAASETPTEFDTSFAEGLFTTAKACPK